MVENGSNGGVWSLPPNESHYDPHEKFFELCAVSTTGSLTPREEKQLREHLAGCAECRELLAQYEAISANVVPAMASEFSSVDSGKDSDSWSATEIDRAEAALFERLDRNEAEPQHKELLNEASEESLLPYIWLQYAAAILLVSTLGLAVYRLGIRKGTENAIVKPPPTLLPSPSPTQVGRNSGQADALRLKEQETGIAALKSQLNERSLEIAQLHSQNDELQKRLKEADGDRIRFDQERTEAVQRLQVAQASLDAAQHKLDAAAGDHTQDMARADILAAKVKELTDTLHARDRELAREQELLDHDRDIRELMGSRDLLYVRDVSDVASTGTQKPFGRVFYTKSKQLTFYAFDLDQQPGIKEATTTFQVWGRRGPEKDQAVSLGVLFQDNASEKRWVMKSNNAKSLSDIDAVFVTAEPTGGSKHPSGKPFLFAYLKIAPNNP